MSSDISSPRIPFSLDQLLSLNDEMIALVRAGVPLSSGLIEFGKGLPGGMGSFATELGRRMDRGEDIGRILRDHERRLPHVWRAVVEAGIRSGKPTAALESIATTMRRIADTRNAIMASLVYPLVVLLVALATLVLYTSYVAPIVLSSIVGLGLQPMTLLKWLAAMGSYATWWGPGLGILLIVLYVRMCSRSQSATRADVGGQMTWLAKVFPGWSTGVRAGRLATFTELLATLIRHQIPTADALTLAATCSADDELIVASQDLANELRSGVTLANAAALDRLPPMTAWLLIMGGSSESLSDTLMDQAAVYRERALRASMRLGTVLPIIATVIVGFVVVLTQALIAFAPVVQLWRGLS